MLISFSVSNFRSIGAEQTLNLVASNKFANHPNHLVAIGGTQKNLVRSAVLYGANAAGKSNIVRAMAVAQDMISGNGRSLRWVVAPFRFSPDFIGKPTSFEFRFLINGRVFIYGFDVKESDIFAEWLCVLDGTDEKVVFERNRTGSTQPGPDIGHLFPEDQEVVSRVNALASLPLKPDQLFLNRAISIPDEAQSQTLRAVIRWLTRELQILLPDHRSTDILDRIANDRDFRLLTEKFLNSVGTGIKKLELTTEKLDVASRWDVLQADAFVLNNQLSFFGGSKPLNFWGLPKRPQTRGPLNDMLPDPENPNRMISRKLVARHTLDDAGESLPFSEESDGTQQLLHLMPVLASVGKEASVIVIDELDRSLHPLLCWEFIRLFSETSPGAHKQLIVTTHEAHLLNQDLLRRDEYWFVEKDNAQQTQLVSLSDFTVRNDLKIEKGYLHGRFGGIPIIGPMTDVEKLINGEA